MPGEQILPLALSGAEIKTAIIDKIQLALAKTCHLNDHLAYSDGFSFKLHLEVKVKDMGHEVETSVDMDQSLKAEMVNEHKLITPTDPAITEGIEPRVADLEGEALDPTALRIETGQSVPTRVTDKQGKDTINQVKFRRDAVLKRLGVEK